MKQEQIVKRPRPRPVPSPLPPLTIGRKIYPNF